MPAGSTIFLKNWPVYLFLLPVFFILHGLLDYYSPSLVLVALELVLIYVAVSLILGAIAWLYLRDITKAALFAFTMMAFNFFYGSAFDFLYGTLGNIFILKYTVLIPAVLLFFGLLLFFLKRSKRTFGRTTLFLNVLFILLIVSDTIFLVPKITDKNVLKVVDMSKELVPSDTTRNPDIYLIIADEYAGQTELKEIFGFDNSSFENELKNRGFHITANTVSNYNATVYSMSSMFNMNYIQNLKKRKVNHSDMLLCREMINKNTILSFLKKRGYTIYNHSPFTFNNQEKAIFNPFFPTKKSLFTSATFARRVKRDVGHNFASKKRIEKVIRHHYFNNKTIDSLAKNTVRINGGPKFVYTHLALPHHPYYFDRDGKEIPLEKLTNDLTMNKEAYIDYLLYSNKKLLDLIDHIKAVSSRPPVIILVSDHGFRQLPVNTDHKYQFMNLNAVYFPDSNYSGFYSGMSNVNEFRVILNAQFGQQLSLLKDSTIYLSE